MEYLKDYLIGVTAGVIAELTIVASAKYNFRIIDMGGSVLTCSILFFGNKHVNNENKQLITSNRLLATSGGFLTPLILSRCIQKYINTPSSNDNLGSIDPLQQSYTSRVTPICREFMFPVFFVGIGFSLVYFIRKYVDHKIVFDAKKLALAEKIFNHQTTNDTKIMDAKLLKVVFDYLKFMHANARTGSNDKALYYEYIGKLFKNGHFRTFYDYHISYL